MVNLAIFFPISRLIQRLIFRFNLTINFSVIDHFTWLFLLIVAFWCLCCCCCMPLHSAIVLDTWYVELWDFRKISNEWAFSGAMGQRKFDILSLCGSFHFWIFTYPLGCLEQRVDANYSCRRFVVVDYVDYIDAWLRQKSKSASVRRVGDSIPTRPLVSWLLCP